MSPLATQRGYTLIEVIVAFALLAMGLTLLLGTLSGSTRQVRWSADAGRAALHAQSLLDTVGITEPLQPGRRDGDFEDGRYRWTLSIAPWQDPALANLPQSPGDRLLYELDMAVQWGAGGPGQQLQVRSLRLVPPDTAGAGVP